MPATSKPDYTRLDLPEPPSHRPYVLTNMVMSADGKIVIDGTEQGIGSKTDQRLMRELRVNADVVLNGASTLRASGASPRLGDETLEAIRLQQGKPRFPVSTVITASGDLPLDRIFFTASDFQAIVFVSANAPAERREAIEATGRPVVQLPEKDAIPAMLHHMRQEMGARVLLLEGGAELNRALLEHDAVDEYFLSIGPVLVGGRHGLSAVGGDDGWPLDEVRLLELLSAVPNPATNEIYTRWRIKHS
jgi:2,5-diamino-6-(ribosylamino)-4(3H)-pyrimidinone 5'-phosphate reductase